MQSGPVSISQVSSPVPGTLSALSTVHLLVNKTLCYSCSSVTMHTMLQYISSAVWLLCLVPGKLIVTLQLITKTNDISIVFDFVFQKQIFSFNL